jgi:hypothetical protein
METLEWFIALYSSRPFKLLSNAISLKAICEWVDHKKTEWNLSLARRE